LNLFNNLFSSKNCKHRRQGEAREQLPSALDGKPQFS
jgi:hypothetical protein